MFGAMKAYEGCALYRETIAKHAKFRQWYERMNKYVIKGYQEMFEMNSNKFGFFNLAVALTGVSNDNECKAALDAHAPTAVNNAEKAEKIIHHHLPELSTTNDLKAQQLIKTKDDNNNLSESLIFRILTLNYLSHLAAFTYAAWMK